MIDLSWLKFEPLSVFLLILVLIKKLIEEISGAYSRNLTMIYWSFLSLKRCKCWDNDRVAYIVWLGH